MSNLPPLQVKLAELQEHILTKFVVCNRLRGSRPPLWVQAYCEVHGYGIIRIFERKLITGDSDVGRTRRDTGFEGCDGALVLALLRVYRCVRKGWLC